MKLITYKQVKVCQSQGIEVLSNVDFQVDDGEFIYIIGRVGSGKSTLLKTLYGELDIDEGKVATILGYDLLTIRRKEIPALRRQLGVVFQDFQLLHDRTIFKNLSFVLKATGWKDKQQVSDRIYEVLNEIGLADKAEKRPHELSGGEQQRIAIARAILNRPKLIIADEPTGNLDNESSDEIMHLLQGIAATGTAVIMSTHNLPILDKYPGKIYQCQDRRLILVTAEEASKQTENDK